MKTILTAEGRLFHLPAGIKDVEKRPVRPTSQLVICNHAEQLATVQCALLYCIYCSCVLNDLIIVQICNMETHIKPVSQLTQNACFRASCVIGNARQISADARIEHVLIFCMRPASLRTPHMHFSDCRKIKNQINSSVYRGRQLEYACVFLSLSLFIILAYSTH